MSVPVSDILKKGDIKGDDLTTVVLSPDEQALSQDHQQNVDRHGTYTHHTSDRTDLQSLVNLKSTVQSFGEETRRESGRS